MFRGFPVGAQEAVPKKSASETSETLGASGTCAESWCPGGLTDDKEVRALDIWTPVQIPRK